MYIYPDNLSAKATLWLWELREKRSQPEPADDGATPADGR